jgi:hypothetical protein
MVDDHGDGVADYNIQVFYGDDLKESNNPEKEPVKVIADTYSSDNSYRCFYIHSRRKCWRSGPTTRRCGWN